MITNVCEKERLHVTKDIEGHFRKAKSAGAEARDLVVRRMLGGMSHTGCRTRVNIISPISVLTKGTKVAIIIARCAFFDRIIGRCLLRLRHLHFLSEDSTRVVVEALVLFPVGLANRNGRWTHAGRSGELD